VKTLIAADAADEVEVQTMAVAQIGVDADVECFMVVRAIKFQTTMVTAALLVAGEAVAITRDLTSRINSKEGTVAGTAGEHTTRDHSNSKVTAAITAATVAVIGLSLTIARSLMEDHREEGHHLVEGLLLMAPTLRPMVEAVHRDMADMVGMVLLQVRGMVAKEAMVEMAQMVDTTKAMEAVATTTAVVVVVDVTEVA
jgi:hypothetical protein